MSQMNIVRRTAAIPTRLLIIVTCASAAGMMVLGVVLYVLIRCHTKEKRRASGAFSDAKTPQVEHANTEESFIQSAPLRFPESEPAFTFPLTQERRRQSVPLLHGIQDNISLRNSMRIPRAGANFSSSGRVDGASQRNHISLRSQESRGSQDSVYSNISLPLSQYSLAFSSDNPASLSQNWPHLAPIPGSPHDTHTSPRSGKPDMPSRELFVQPKRKPTESAPYPLSPPTTQDSTHISLSSESAPTPIRSSSFSGNMLQDSDHLTAFPPAGFRRRRSQPNTDPEMYSSHHNPPMPIPEIFPENSGRIGPLSTSHYSPSQVPERKAIPEPLRLPRSPENYASVMYARSRGPEVPSVKKGRGRVNAFPPTVSAAVGGGGVHDTQGMRNSPEIFKGKLTTFNESSPVFQLSRPTLPSPTWSTFRDSPGWI